MKLRRRVEEVASAEPQPKSNFVHFILKQGSHASWKVLDFFSLKFQDLESPGKSLWSWKVLEKYHGKLHITYGSNGKQAVYIETMQISSSDF